MMAAQFANYQISPRNGRGREEHPVVSLPEVAGRCVYSPELPWTIFCQEGDRWDLGEMDHLHFLVFTRHNAMLDT